MSSDQLVFDPEFQLNKFFNELPIRVVGSSKYPMFYADDIARILGVRRVDNIIRKYDEYEIVSRDVRKKHKITTFKDDGRVDNKRVLLTEFGAIRFIMETKSELSYSLRSWMYKILYEARLTETQPINVIDESKMHIENKLSDNTKKLLERTKKYESLLETLYIFELPVDVRLISQNNLHDEDELLEDSIMRQDEWYDEQNTIDNYEAYCKFIDEYPHMKMSDRERYKLVKNPSGSDHNSYQMKYKVFCKDADALLKKVKERLFTHQIDCIDGNIFECELDLLKSIISDEALLCKK